MITCYHIFSPENFTHCFLTVCSELGFASSLKDGSCMVSPNRDAAIIDTTFRKEKNLGNTPEVCYTYPAKVTKINEKSVLTQ
jgi:hypothetical protein